MNVERIQELLRNGEGLSVEFKRCSGRIEHDVFETVCVFLNRFGGDLLLGVEDGGAVVGIGGDVVALCNNIMNMTVVQIAPKPQKVAPIRGEVALKGLEVALNQPEVARMAWRRSRPRKRSFDTIWGNRIWR